MFLDFIRALLLLLLLLLHKYRHPASRHQQDSSQGVRVSVCVAKEESPKVCLKAVGNRRQKARRCTMTKPAKYPGFDTIEQCCVKANWSPLVSDNECFHLWALKFSRVEGSTAGTSTLNPSISWGSPTDPRCRGSSKAQLGVDLVALCGGSHPLGLLFRIGDRTKRFLGRLEAWQSETDRAACGTVTLWWSGLGALESEGY